MELQSSKSKKIRIFTSFVICLFLHCCISFKAAAVEKENITSYNEPQAVRVLPVADSLSAGTNFLKVTLPTYDPQNNSTPDPEKKTVRIVPKFEFFGDSLWHCPLIDYKSDYFVVGAFYAPNPIVYADKKDYCAINFTTEDLEKIKKQIPKNIEKFIQNGWFLSLPTDRLSYYMIDENPIVYNIEKKYLVDPPIYPAITTGINTTNHQPEPVPLGRYYIEPDAYLLVLIKSDYFRYIEDHRIDGDDILLRLNLKSDGAYYPFVFPLIFKQYEVDN